ncbi:MAG: 1,4-dihydroxy-6-naphthoate synthase [Hamadaea sp.]|uniref:1,4-dihydroxy-6-naphthoate synthase n=1 Tax=Hamadaea sp. NPDC050747 TaxID=3155789 RepID=UPI0017E03015|nr:1,4-dihydroxy-6-naphthoate synthase [Hamadaea sp.]NUT04102.1 1,4-dihydroxy-6-naphthoate synthase [Hamadaea sp.]
MKIAYSPCPNDTFVFHALTHGLVPGAPEFDVTFADVDVTNTAALDGRFDLVKVSYAALPWLLDQYELLPCGGALGRGCGPLLLTLTEAGIDGKTVAVPGERTTAYLLMRLWAEQTGQRPADIVVVPFHEIMPGVAAGRFDAGLVIHEARFTYPRYGLSQLVDLGEWWESDTGSPIPLGAILAKRGAVDPRAATEWIRASVRHAWARPEDSREYVLAHAQEMEQTVVDQHISLYVNEFTEDLGLAGYAAVRELLERSEKAGLTPGIAVGLDDLAR